MEQKLESWKQILVNSNVLLVIKLNEGSRLQEERI
ncbi:hypothetical protein ABIE66_002428 [Peribacillus sp. B2I2]